MFLFLGLYYTLSKDHPLLAQYLNGGASFKHTVSSRTDSSMKLMASKQDVLVMVLDLVCYLIMAVTASPWSSRLWCFPRHSKLAIIPLLCSFSLLQCQLSISQLLRSTTQELFTCHLSTALEKVLFLLWSFTLSLASPVMAFGQLKCSVDLGQTLLVLKQSIWVSLFSCWCLFLQSSPWFWVSLLSSKLSISLHLLKLKKSFSVHSLFNFSHGLTCQCCCSFWVILVMCKKTLLSVLDLFH